MCLLEGVKGGEWQKQCCTIVMQVQPLLFIHHDAIQIEKRKVYGAVLENLQIPLTGFHFSWILCDICGYITGNKDYAELGDLAVECQLWLIDWSWINTWKFKSVSGFLWISLWRFQILLVSESRIEVNYFYTTQDKKLVLN